MVEDLHQKAALGELYRRASMPAFMRERDSASTDATRRVYEDAIGLAQNLDRVPVIVIPCCLGVPPIDAAGAAGFFGSILPAAWSFQLALRVRGLGSAYTSAILARAGELREILSLPVDVTPAAMIPVGYTLGTRFRPARRSDPVDVTYIDRWESIRADGTAGA
ncbi:hypothetical protein GCM10009807_24620 [Microbacterium lacus]|uniref:Nitroreductase domain-containing protein n=1 Tax=Microbacterium lacus TaxID=415217 RepID=A0ABP4SZM8_9MICO